MGKFVIEKLNEIPKERQDRILAEANWIQMEYKTLKQLRKAKKLTQSELAARLKVSQETIAQTENRKNMMLSTLRNYVEKMGGKLKVTAEFPGHIPVTLTGFHDHDEPEIS